MESLFNGRTSIDKSIKSHIDNRLGFTPKNEVEFTALEIATALNDVTNLAFHIKTVKDVSVLKAREFLSLTLEDIKIAESKNNKIRNPAALYNWKVQNFKRRAR